MDDIIKDYYNAAKLESTKAEEQEEAKTSSVSVSGRSIIKRSLISDPNMMTIFKEVFQETRSGLTNIVRIVERYYSLSGDVAIMCAGNNTVACDLVSVLRQLMILKGMSQQIYYNKVRSLLEFKELDLPKYLEQLKLSRDFRTLLTSVKYDASTVITVTQEVSNRLNNYFTAIASFDKAIGNADMGFITGRIKEIKEGSRRLWDEKIAISLDTILKGAVVILSAEVAEKTAALVFQIMKCFNPVAMAAGNCDGPAILDRMQDLMTAIRHLANAGRLLTGLQQLKDEVTSLQQKFAENENQLRDIQNVLDTFVNASDTDKVKMAQDFIDKYGGYTPKVTDQDLARISASLEYTALAGCDLISDAGGVSGNIGGTVLDGAFGNCATIGAELAELDAFYDDLFSFQFELVDSFVKIVRSDIATVHSNAISSSTTQVSVRPMVIGLLMDEIKIQRAARAVCDELEYRASASRPPVCKTMFFSDGALQQLISYSSSVSMSRVIHYAYIPTEPSTTLNDKSFLDIDSLIEGKSVFFRPPYQDLEWLKTYNWIPKDYDLETGFYIERMGVFIPGIKCQEGDDLPVAVSVELTNQKAVRIHPSSLVPSYLIPPRTSTFTYEDNSAYCQPCSETLFPVKENSQPDKIKAQKTLCVKSEGVVPSCQSVSFPSLFSSWKIRLISGSCTLVKVTNLGYTPMVTVVLTKVEVKAPTDECWPNPCQYGGSCADGLMDFTCTCKSPMTGKLCNEVQTGYEGSSPNACDMTTNIALDRPSQESSVYHLLGAGLFLRASFANDADTRSGDLLKCSHTNNDNQPYWYVELPLTHKVCAVKITNRGDSGSAAARLGGAKVVISDRDPSLPERVETLCGTVKSNPGNGEVITITCTEPIPASKGRYLTLYIPRTEYLHICDFQAFTTRATSPAFSTVPSGWKTCDWTTNIARSGRRKSVSQKNTYIHSTSASRVVDGDVATDDWRKCSQTELTTEPWLAIEFHQKQTICGVKVLQRGDSSASRSAFAKIGVLNNVPSKDIDPEKSNIKLCGSLPGTIRTGDMNTVSCELFPVEGTTLVIYVPGHNYLNLCEVMVFAAN